MKKKTLNIIWILFLFSFCDKQVELKSGENKVKISLSDIKENLKNKNIIHYNDDYFIKSIVYIDKTTPVIKGEEKAREHAKRIMVESKSMRITARKELKQTYYENKNQKDVIFTNHIEQTSTGNFESFDVLEMNAEEITGGVKITLIARIIYK